MVNGLPAGLDATFGALADPTRRAILARLARGAATVGELAEPFDVSLPAISKHLRVLEHAGLMAREKQGRVHHCRLVLAPLHDAAQWLLFHERLWEGTFDSLAAFFAADKDTGDATGRGAAPEAAPESVER
jgi:DNA-binding transcriptional ArsR family regulator